MDNATARLKLSHYPHYPKVRGTHFFEQLRHPPSITNDIMDNNIIIYNNNRTEIFAKSALSQIILFGVISYYQCGYSWISRIIKAVDH